MPNDSEHQLTRVNEIDALVQRYIDDYPTSAGTLATVRALLDLLRLRIEQPELRDVLDTPDRANATAAAPSPGIKRTKVWIVLEIEHDTYDEDLDLLVFQVLDMDIFQDALHDHGRSRCRNVNVTTAFSDVDLERLQRFAGDAPTHH